MRPQRPRVLSFLLGFELQLAASTGVILGVARVSVKDGLQNRDPGPPSRPGAEDKGCLLGPH